MGQEEVQMKVLGKLEKNDQNTSADVLMEESDTTAFDFHE